MSLESELTKLANLDDISYSFEDGTTNEVDAKEIIFKGWPTTKAVLETIASIIKNPFIKIIIRILITAGDALFSKSNA